MEQLKHSHMPEYLAEGAGTAFLVFVGLSAVVFDFSTGSPVIHLLPDPSARRLLTGLLFAGSGSLVAISPLGKLSGGHINPSVSLAFWLYGKLNRSDLLGYIVSQFIGGIIGAFLLARVWGNRATSVTNGMTLPGKGYPLWLVFGSELVLTLLLVLGIFIFVSSSRLMRWTPLMTWMLVACMVWIEAPVSGTSLNPARSFGPALITWLWTAQWLYFIAPPLGAIGAVLLYRWLKAEEQDVLTGKLFHVPDYRSLFQNVTAPHLPAHGELRASQP